MTTNEEVRKLLHRYIPGGCHTYTKGDDQWPLNAPAAIERGKGCHVWDAEGNRFVDWSMGLAAVSFGHANDELNRPAIEAMSLGHNFQRPSVIEARAAEALVEFLGNKGEMVKFAKNGSTVTTAAVKLARAFTRRGKVVVCGDHPFFSYDDWFIGSTRAADGIPRGAKELTLKFKYNDLESLSCLFRAHSGEISCVIMEALKFERPLPGFLDGVRQLCHSHGAIFIVDEMISGFKWHKTGASTFYNVEADLYTWGKGLANGHSVCALTGRADIMRLGGGKHDSPRVFLSSTTHGAEIPQLAVLLEVLRFVEARPSLFQDNFAKGAQLRREIGAEIQSNGLSEVLSFTGDDCYFTLAVRDTPRHSAPVVKTFLLQELIKQGQLFQGIFFPTIAHEENVLLQTVAAWKAVLPSVAHFVAKGTRDLLSGPATRPVFRAFNSCECLSEDDCRRCAAKIAEMSLY